MAVGVAGPNHRQLISMLTNSREVIRNQQATFPAWPKRAKRRCQKANSPPTGIDVLLPVRQGLTGVFLQGRFVIKGVDLTGGAIHHQKDAGFSLRRKMRLTGCQRPGTACIPGSGLATEESLRLQQ